MSFDGTFELEALDEFGFEETWREERQDDVGRVQMLQHERPPRFPGTDVAVDPQRCDGIALEAVSSLNSSLAGSTSACAAGFDVRR